MGHKILVKGTKDSKDCLQTCDFKVVLFTSMFRYDYVLSLRYYQVLKYIQIH